jgi:hypothetical protein
MPPKKQKFTVLRDDLQKATDVDDSAGRSVPVNMNYVDEGFLTKDTGAIPYGIPTDLLAHSLFNYKKKNGVSYKLRGYGTKLQKYSEADREWLDIPDSPTFTTDALFGYVVYDNNLYFGNAVESMHKWDGATFTEYASAPKGNIFEIFEDRLFITGVLAEPLTIYYSNVGVPTTFTGADVLKPLGTDHVTSLKNYYGNLLIFKKNSIWKLTFVYDSVVSLFVPKLEIQNGNYGACSRGAVTWAENDIWFFTGVETRSIGYKDQQTGVLGVNTSVISNDIKETLKLIDLANYDSVTTFYNNRRYYLGIPLSGATNDTLFVCHLLYENKWTKYTGRNKAQLGSSMVVDDVIYTSNQSSPYGILKWTVTEEDSLPQNAYLVTES